MSLRYGIRYSWNVGRPPLSGRYRLTRKTTSESAINTSSPRAATS